MKCYYKEFPSDSERCFSICDAKIDKICCKRDLVQFHFSNGFYIIEKNQLIKAETGYIEFGCSADEFICHMIKRKSTKKGANLYGTPMPLSKLEHLLTKEEKKIEIYLELYNFNFLYWRGSLQPYRNTRLSDRIDIELSGKFPMTYCWNRKSD